MNGTELHDKMSDIILKTALLPTQLFVQDAANKKANRKQAQPAEILPIQKAFSLVLVL